MDGLSTLEECVDSSQGQGMGGYHHTGMKARRNSPEIEA